eukprot:gene4775-5025_t
MVVQVEAWGHTAIRMQTELQSGQVYYFSGHLALDPRDDQRSSDHGPALTVMVEDWAAVEPASVPPGRPTYKYSGKKTAFMEGADITALATQAAVQRLTLEDGLLSEAAMQGPDCRAWPQLLRAAKFSTVAAADEFYNEVVAFAEGRILLPVPLSRSGEVMMKPLREHLLSPVCKLAQQVLLQEQQSGVSITYFQLKVLLALWKLKIERPSQLMAISQPIVS